jgi:hypothetical protein
MLLVFIFGILSEKNSKTYKVYEETFQKKGRLVTLCIQNIQRPSHQRAFFYAMDCRKVCCND